MKGSEKQIAWAEELKEKAVDTFNHLKDADPSEDGKKQAEVMIEAIKNAEYAGDIISIFKYVNFNGDWMHDIKEISSVYRVTVPETEGQKKILGK